MQDQSGEGPQSSGHPCRKKVSSRAARVPGIKPFPEPCHGPGRGSSSHDSLVLAVVPHTLQRVTPGSLAEVMQLPGRASAQVWVQSSHPGCNEPASSSEDPGIEDS